jgi:hypothetical protein
VNRVTLLEAAKTKLSGPLVYAQVTWIKGKGTAARTRRKWRRRGSGKRRCGEKRRYRGERLRKLFQMYFNFKTVYLLPRESKTHQSQRKKAKLFRPNDSNININELNISEIKMVN